MIIFTAICSLPDEKPTITLRTLDAVGPADDEDLTIEPTQAIVKSAKGANNKKLSKQSKVVKF